MAGKDTFSISRTELRRILTAYKVSETSIQKALGEMEKAHRHINVVAFVGLLEKSSISRPNISNVLRRLGMNDVMISDTLNMADEQKTIAESGRIYDATVEFG